MDVTQETEQAKLWNGPAGRAWVESQELLDRLLKPFEALLVEQVSAAGRLQVLDVGCGTGATTLAVARLLEGKGACTGLDISEPMTTAAKARAEREKTPARFICANAQAYEFESRFDMIVSRFGVMFFDDPVRAFSNLRRAVTDDGEIRFIAWRSAAENPFMTTAERAAASLLPNLPARKPDGPGQFAFGNGQRVHTILEESGWKRIDLRPVDVTCTLPEKELVPYLTHVGPVGLALQEADDATRARVVDALRAAFTPYIYGAEARFETACWLVGAQAG